MVDRCYEIVGLLVVKFGEKVFDGRVFGERVFGERVFDDANDGH